MGRLKLFQPTDIASLVFFRVAYGVLALMDILSTYIYYHLQKNAFDPKAFQFTYYGFGWVQPLPEPLMSGLFISLILAAVAIILGRWYRTATLYFAVGFTYVFLLEKAHYLNHGYLFCWLAFIMVFLPADRNWSWSVWKKPERRLETIPFWCLLVLRFLIGVVYFFGGIAKINGDWLRGVPLVDWMAYKSSLPIIGPVLGLSWTPYLMAYVGLFLDLTIVLFLINRRTRPWAFGMAICFHLLNMLIFNIGIFPYLSVSLTALYFSPSFPRRIGNYLAGRFSWLARLSERWQQRMHQAPANTSYTWQADPRFRKPILTGLVILAAFYILVPLRHHLFPGNVAWTEEGHRYSWRMMLRSKQGRGHFRVEDDRGMKEIVRPQEFLSDRQERKLYTHPDMILQFAHFLHDRYEREGKPVAVFAEIEARLNDRPYQTYIDPSVDLAKEEWSHTKPSDWILPLAE
ncbi:hypothetical protein CRP01_25575 [Flavilitoribacter nigricans DSM 23189 = NBRC 102662]|uniref:HTTM-like domain-containing protein n=2 Tax=Flavilitoribacter TaxID=2762562 RepID=A0A2D0N521_FLAN2|nr:hypothetical protein CRP01_25575 [Flavilitoribacter nigricans DSM 23189 = NBRC 102662]